jgi:hypothetical protein
MKKQVNVIVDGINLNASHFGAMTKDEAVKRIAADNILKEHGKDEAWAASAWEQAKAELEKADEKAKKEFDKTKKASDKTTEVAAKVESKLPPPPPGQ